MGTSAISSNIRVGREEWLQVFDGLPVAVLLVGHDGRIRYANPEAARLTGYRADELQDQPVESLMPEEQRAAHRRQRPAVSSSTTRAPSTRWSSATCCAAT